MKQKGNSNKNLFQIGRDLVINIGSGFTLSFLIVVVFIGITGIYLYKTNYYYESIRHTSEKNNKVTIGNLIVAEKDKYYQIEVAVYNPLQRDISVIKLEIERKYNLGMGCSGAETINYIISDIAYISKLDKASNKFTLPIFRYSDVLSKSKYWGHGKETNFCGSSSLELSFDTSFLLQSNSYTFFLIDIPKTIKTSQNAFNIKNIETVMTPEFFDKNFVDFAINLSLNTDIKQKISFTKEFIEF